ncbi:hypothetical protein CEXT_338891 [Caerostris extrusa]|uniref:Secreted protein n=1 Tax=Caerostris extrusa TaxID=172846 RepID=A0AAV4XM97_CAEEX|nr:hypothetical protein CEXT_338891 [Caerostris extrusa]
MMVMMKMDASLLRVLSIPAKVHCQLCLQLTSWRMYSPLGRPRRAPRSRTGRGSSGNRPPTGSDWEKEKEANEHS